MPINFVTGLPRQGKTLFTFVQVRERAEKENRPVYYCNIPEVTIPGWIEIDHPDKWMECPNDSIIVVDELQDFWGAASSGSRVPPPILELSKHGKRGIDFYFITQDPTLVHATPRKLCETHWHVVRAFGSQAAIAYKHRGMQTDPGKVAHKAEKYPWKYPLGAFGKKDKAGNWISQPWYKSADVHNIKRRIPLKVWAIPLALAVAIGAVWFAVSSVLNYGGKIAAVSAANSPAGTGTAGVLSGPGARPPSAAGVSPEKPSTAEQYLEQRRPRVADFPHTAPAYDQVTQPTEAPYPAACVQMGNTCKCYSQQATYLRVSAENCAQIVKYGFFMDWAKPEPKNREPRNSEKPASVKVSAPAPTRPSASVTLPDFPEPDPSKIAPGQIASALGIRNPAFTGGVR